MTLKPASLAGFYFGTDVIFRYEKNDLPLLDPAANACSVQ